MLRAKCRVVHAHNARRGRRRVSAHQHWNRLTHAWWLQSKQHAGCSAGFGERHNGNGLRGASTDMATGAGRPRMARAAAGDVRRGGLPMDGREAIGAMVVRKRVSRRAPSHQSRNTGVMTQARDERLHGRIDMTARAGLSRMARGTGRGCQRRRGRVPAHEVGSLVRWRLWKRGNSLSADGSR